MVLLIEDDPGDARLMREMVAKARGGAFDFEWAEDLSAGLERLAAGGIDVVLLDLSLPDSQGLDTFIKAHAQAARVPIIVLTGLDDEELAVKAMREGAQDYLVKGEVDTNLLVRAMRYAIERKRTEKALVESEARSRLILQTMPSGLFTVDLDRKITSWNKEATAITGLKAEKVIGKDCIEVLGSDVCKRGCALFNDKVDKPVYGEECVIHLAGRETTISRNIDILKDSEGNNIGGLQTFVDITERRHSEEALRGSEERYRRITEAVTDYIFTVRIEDGHPMETVHSPACVAVTGYAPEEFASDPYLWIRMVHEEDRAAVQEQVRSLLLGQEAQPIEHRILRKDGVIRWVRNTLVPHYDTQGKLLSYDGLIRDMHEQKEAEEANATLEA